MQTTRWTAPSKTTRFEIMLRGVGFVMAVWGVRGHRDACALAANILGVSEDMVGASRVEQRARKAS